MMRRDVFGHVALDASDDVALLKKIASDLPILSDVCRADLLMYCRAKGSRVVTVAQARPHSFSPLYGENRVGLFVGEVTHPDVCRWLGGQHAPSRVQTVSLRGVTVARELYPVRNASKKLIAVVVKDAYWLAHERHRRRSRVFQEALHDLVTMVLRGDLRGAEDLSPFGEHDGIVWVDRERQIQYMSGIAAELYRRLGYREDLLGEHISRIEGVDRELVTVALDEQRAHQVTTEHDSLTWTRKVLPIWCPDVKRRWFHWPWEVAGQPRAVRPPLPLGALILVHDETEALQAQRELESKLALVREVHHRVKNNLQVVASIMRMQARRVESDEARTVLEESVNRILSVAVVHEFLSRNAQGTFNLHEVTNRILGQIKQGLLAPDKNINLHMRGPDIWLPAERATQCALVINELVQNAIEHGMADRQQGTILVELVDEGESVSIMVRDDGAGLPEGFDLATSSNLGLNIVCSMVQRDLQGTFSLSNGAEGTEALIRFQKTVAGGR